ncbi:hypothetical protein Tco_0606198 [Tanacetum coccineum]
MDIGKGRSSGDDDDGFIEVKKKKSGGNNGGTNNFKPVSVKPKTIYPPKVNQSTVEDSLKTAPSAAIGGEVRAFGYDGKPLEKDEPFKKEMESYLASKPSGFGYGTNSLLE